MAAAEAQEPSAVRFRWQTQPEFWAAMREQDLSPRANNVGTVGTVVAALVGLAVVVGALYVEDTTGMIQGNYGDQGAFALAFFAGGLVFGITQSLAARLNLARARRRVAR